MYAVNLFGKYQCPCCGFFTLDEGRNNSFDICPVCFWEDDSFQLHHPDSGGGPNTPSLNEAQNNFRTYGACEQTMLIHVRPPFPEEMPDDM
ncbi:CPCC family cysteine-rich protein [Hymenobacter actinosclerus]|uniref:Cysteine-rich CPCC n=1 Tax=Hymenobacter actinosclerus TaxID=82805 RepID=A0A1I0DEJ4_9BACT|nr:CPCC family cysteine-rich protein [Hymenobacter actinosclerus]SET30156.1 Cysteine-rich CPCC [Hymenobacter actinosclerus]